MTTEYHARYFAHERTRQAPPNGVERLSMSLFDACVDLNPHQIEAALFALRSPISKGVLLADDVGLGKTIEAGNDLSRMIKRQLRGAGLPLNLSAHSDPRTTRLYDHSERRVTRNLME